MGGLPPPSEARCQSSSAIALLKQGADVIAYVPEGSWYLQHTGIWRMHLEGPATLPDAAIPTPQVVNSCASNSARGQTVCIANDTDIYLVADAAIQSTLTSAGSGTARFSLGNCTDCNLAFDLAKDTAIIGLVAAAGPAFQPLDLSSATPELGAPIISPAGRLGETLGIDSKRKLLLSPSEGDNFEIADLSQLADPAFFEDQAGVLDINELDGVAEDCATGVAVVSDELTGKLLLTDLTQATFTPGTPNGSWSAPTQLQDLPDFSAAIARSGGVAIAEGSHFGAVAGEIAGNALGAFQLPASSGGVPALADWVVCGIPDDPDGTPWAMGLDPHPLSAYVSPSTGHAMAVVANSPPTFLALIDLTDMINAADLPRAPGTHTCSAGILPPSLVSFISLPA